MNIRLHLKICAYLLALIGLWSVTYTDYFSIVWPSASTLLVLAGWFYEGPRRHQTAYRRMWMVIGLLMLLSFPVNMVYTRSLLLPAVHLSIFAQAYSLLNVKNERAYRRILTISFAQILASTNLTTDLRFGVLISAYCLAATYFVLLMFILTGIQKGGASDGRAPGKEAIPQGLFLFSVVLAAALIPLTLTFFYSMPRLRYALIARNNPIDSLNQMRVARQRTGFTKIVELGTYGRVQEDQTLALRVEVPAAQGRPLETRMRWRGGALNIYDGVAWSSSRDHFRYFNGRKWNVTNKNMGSIFPRMNSQFIADDDYALDRIEQLDASPELLKQVFYLEIPFSESLFAAGDIKVIQGPFRYGVARDFNSSFYINNRQALPDLISYTVYSSADQPTAEQLGNVSWEDLQTFTQSGRYGNYIRRSFLQLPPSLNPQVRQLAEDVTRNYSKPYDKIVALRRFLETNYTYSLDLQKPLNDDPLYDFLFISKSGHCEYFATAMTIMCRAVGIPARLARGFQQGAWNEAGSFYEVRQKDSHAWVEVLFPQYGWAEFDPSPRAVADDYFESRRSVMAKMMSKQLLRMRIFWRQNVIGYNEARRMRLLGEAAEFTRNLPRLLAQLIGHGGKAVRNLSGMTLFSLILVLAMSLVLFRILRKFGHKIPPRLRFLTSLSRNGNGAAFYGKMLKLLEKRKIVKPLHLTPFEFLELPALREHPRHSDIETLTSLYYRTRYGGRALVDEEIAAVHDILAGLRHANGHTSTAPRNGGS
ncbi:MAG: DUF3488 domain-containing protein [Candidatus Abyssobacteria bacterium SURF_5]|uniref:DUF3488 domain-containing protein n=1 Tax=Abyssobacteria bacterium (strain SURF_5) TaxID=2093360 RepID=A0A3A4PB25_ABYX5|nr:MAG: DUF3488 domain-containing protein [Candidatus Abyssubacteria bacterium SURF_5]